jgi:hypothetical protein
MGRPLPEAAPAIARALVVAGSRLLRCLCSFRFARPEGGVNQVARLVPRPAETN